MNCPLCRSSEMVIHGKRRFKPHWQYFRCSHCYLVFRDPNSWPDREEEEARYTAHNNDPDDEGYRRFLGRMISPLLEHVPPPASVLDWGCGPHDLLADLLRREGYDCSAYDPLFYREEGLLQKSYSLICSTEVFEHFRQPAKELDRLVSLLKPRGYLAVMTQPLREEDFEGWHYLSDLTHILFYSPECFRWIAEKWKLEMLYQQRDITILQRRNGLIS